MKREKFDQVCRHFYECEKEYREFTFPFINDGWDDEGQGPRKPMSGEDIKMANELRKRMRDAERGIYEFDRL